MANYIPANKIKPNQYTYGNEWYKSSSGEEYIGFYYLLASGKAYTGKNQNDGPNEEIFQIQHEDEFSKWPVYKDDADGIVNFSQIADNYDGYTFETQYQQPQDVNQYANLIEADITQTRYIPVYEPTMPTEEDYQIGYFRRYFVVKTNELIYTEVNEETFKALESEKSDMLWEQYIPFSMRWTISGRIDDVFITNRNLIKLTEKQIKRKKFSMYISDMLEFYKYIPQENLTAPPNLLIDKDGNDYIGSYHIHEMMGPMEGATHTQTPHQKLFYKRFYDPQGIELVVSGSYTANPTITLTGQETNINYEVLTGNDSSGGSSGGSTQVGGQDPQMPGGEKTQDYGEGAGSGGAQGGGDGSSGPDADYPG